MVQYLLNVTFIWLLSLLAFNIFYRKETFHSLNRIYLWLAIAAGLIISLVSWGMDSFIYHSYILSQPAIQATALKQSIEPATLTATSQLSIASALTFIYLIGVAVFFLILIKEGRKLYGYYKNGKHCFEDDQHIIYTAAPHTPFSFMKTIFVTDRNIYSDAEWT
jgi:beta-lactamase regulating signal transducer with metallopeptidase domain